ncbi:MAG: DNA methylase [Amphiplicatus sp.]
MAFIEAAWRRYTKHSRNKAQEIQAAILPIAEKHAWDRPFLGVVLAGEFTKGSLDQLDSIGFKVLYFPYKSIVDAFASVEIDARFDESTPAAAFEKCISKMQALSEPQWESLKSHLIDNQRQLYDRFISELQESLDRSVESAAVVPLFGKEYGFTSLRDALAFLNEHEEKEGGGAFMRYEARIKYDNGDTIDASFRNKKDMQKFIEYIGS